MSRKKGEYGYYHETTTNVRFHQDHYMQVRAARKETTTLPDQDDYSEEGGEVPHHELLGTIIENSDGGQYIIDKVTRQWYCGWYLAVCARAKGTRSHALLYWENETCRLAFIQDIIEETGRKYKVIDKVDEEEIENF